MTETSTARDPGLASASLARNNAVASDGELLSAFAARRDEDAFAALVRRHGPMVFGICRHQLGGIQDAEDAFQAVFLVLARKAEALRRPEGLAGWLHGVACRVARNARRAAGRRLAREAQVVPGTPPTPAWEAAWREVQSILDEEIERLPEKYQTVFILCCLEGEGRADAAVRLGIKEGTVASRLAEARRRLQQRLAARGIALSTVLGAAAVWSPPATATLPIALAATTTRTALAFAGGQAGAATPVTALANATLRKLWLVRIRYLGIMVLLAGVLGGTAAAAYFAHLAGYAVPLPPNAGPAVAPGAAVPIASDAGAGHPSRRLTRPAAQEKPLEEWIEALKSPDKEVRLRAAEAIGRFGPAGKAAVPALKNTLADRETEVQQAVAVALWKVDRSAFAGVFKDKKDPTKGRWAATLALLRLGADAKDLAPLVLQMAADAQDDDRAHALWALPALEVDVGEAVPVLVRALEDHSAQYARMLAAQALGQYGPRAKQALPALKAALSDADPQVRVDAAGALWKVGKDATKVLPVLVDALKASNNGGPAAARQRAVRYLGVMGPAAADAFPALLAHWRATAGSQRAELGTALRAIDAKGAAAAGID
jgi:RNA polymerase sigma factor (sigma-70 family)